MTPARTPCRHLCGSAGGCSIYANRPGLCAEYRCAWLDGAGLGKDRPDRSGVLVELRTMRHGPGLFAKSYRPHAVRSPRGKRAIWRMTRDLQMACIVADENDMEIIRVDGPTGAVKKFRETYGCPDNRS